MAWSSAALSAAESTGFAADKPVIGAQVCPRSPTDVRWNTTGSLATADDVNASYPCHRVYDGKLQYTSTRTTAATQSYLIFDFAAAGIEFDALLLGSGHNLYTDACNLTLDIDDASNFSGASNLLTVASFAANMRYAAWDLHHTGSVPLRYSAVRYARLGMLSAGAVTPELSEVIFLRRRQLPRNPSTPFNPTALRAQSEIGATAGGSLTNHIDHEGRFDLSARWPLKSDAEAADVEAWYKQCGGQVIYCPQPTTYPHRFNLMQIADYSLELPVQGFVKRTFTLESVEQGPERFYLSKEV